MKEKNLEITKIKEGMDFREFIGSAYLGGTGNRYEFGKDPIEMEDKQTIEELLYHINALSKAALNKVVNSRMENNNPYIERKLIKAKADLREAYLRLMDMR